jgi:endonuclease YncB( thermonuclease family)
MFWAAWRFSDMNDIQTPVVTAGQKIIVMDGDSFNVGSKKFRLDGIDAPEFNQTCKDAQNIIWECGKAARGALEAMLSLPGLKCSVSAQDSYSRSIAKCAVDQMPDVGGAQVRAGMAVSHEYYGIRTYGDEEDHAIAAKMGIWAGEFASPSEWRKAHPSRTNK